MKRLIKKVAGWIQLDYDKTTAVSSSYGEGDNSKNTWFQRGILTLDELDGATGYNNENRQWTESNGEKMFGNYTEEQWNEFLEDIKINGVKWPIMVEVYIDGSKKIVEGNHRIAACRQLGINEIPAEVRYMGQSQQQYKIQ